MAAMTTELPKQYQPAECQAKWLDYWKENGYFNADPDPAKKSHTIMIPLPNVTGALHMGHALNGTLQDLITRWRRMQGYEALWMPGTDHAGIATQAVVERRMFEEEGLTRHDIGREALVNRIWRWKDAYEKRILEQLRQLGASCDWRRTRFTLDEVCSRAVRRTFFRFFKDGLIYRGKRLVNWDTHLQTAVADDEVFHEEVEGHFWTFTYPVVGDDGQPTGVTIAFSTTRPETMLGDTAVCVHPTDERYEHLIGKQVQIPLNGRLIPIIADALLAKKEMGTGCVKVTPAHDPNDYACGLRNGLPMINILNSDGTINAEGGRYEGVDRHEARQRVVEDMKELGHFVSVEDRKIELAHSDRSKTPVEPYLSDQWFVMMGDHGNGEPGLAQKAIDAVRDRRVRFFPQRYQSSYIDWLAEKRDWCISRQLWWGHRIPVWSEEQNDLETANLTKRHIELQPWFNPDSVYIHIEGSQGPVPSGQHGTTAVAAVPRCRVLVCVDYGHDDVERELKNLGFAQDEDVLDTWFSSALWPYATLGWPDTEHEPPLCSDMNIDGALEEVSGKELASDRRTRSLVPQIIAIEERVFPVDFKDGVLRVAMTPPLRPATLNRLAFAGATCVQKYTVEPVFARQIDIDAAIAKYYIGDEVLTAKAEELARSGNPVLDFFYPGSVLITSRDIITLWVARMVLTGLYNMGDVPFEHVHVHPKILDGFGQTMSKSKGNGCDPVDLINRYGTDAVRFTIASFAGETQDVKLPMSYECPHCGTLVPQTLDSDGTMVKPQTLKGTLRGSSDRPMMPCPKCKVESLFSTPQYEAEPGEPVARMVSERFEYGRNFCNKFWNAARFAIMNLEGYTPGEVTEADLRLEDRWILSRLSRVAGDLTTQLGRYQFDAATRSLRDFTWNEFCDWYLEMIKPRLRAGAADEEAGASAAGGDERAVAQRVLVAVLDNLIRLLQPFTPFVCEELWQRLKEIAPERGLMEPSVQADSVMVAAWPELPAAWQDDALEARFNRLQETVVAVRNIRALYNIGPTLPMQLYLKCEAGVADELRGCADQFDNLSRTVLAAAGADVVRPAASASFNLADADGYVPLGDLIDVDAELARLKKEGDKLRGFIKGHASKLSNESFVSKAPEQVVVQVRETLAGLEKQLESVETVIGQLSGTSGN